MQRMLRGFSQEKLGEALGVTFQQVQKYEKGANRIGASRLQQISRILKVPPSFFFEGSPTHAAGSAPPGFEEAAPPTFVPDFLSTSEGLQLNRAFFRIRDPRIRKRIVDLVTTLAESADALQASSDSPTKDDPLPPRRILRSR